MDAETTFHRSLEQWAGEHARRFAGIDVLPYDPDRYPEQRIETTKTPTADDLDPLPPERLTELLRTEYEQTLGAASAPRTVIEPLADELRAFARSGRNLAVLTAHAEHLNDTGAFCGAIAIALGDAGLIRHNATILNKLMSRECYTGLPIARLLGSFANIYWVVPETESARRWGIDEDVTRRVNGNAVRTILADMQEGILLTLAPSGSTMRKELDGEGELASLTIPPVAASTAKLIARFDAYVVAALWDGRASIGPIVPIVAPPRTHRLERRRHEIAVVDEAMGTMAELTEQLAGVPVRYGSTAMA